MPETRLNAPRLHLIRRRLAVLRREINERLQARTLTSLSTMTEYASAELRAGRGGAALILVPLRSLDELRNFIVTETRDWPVKVWDQIRPDLRPEHATASNRAILSALLDEFSWPVGGRPFTLNYLDQARITAALARHAERLGQRDTDGWDSLIRQANQSLGLAELTIRNTAVVAREKAVIALEEFLLNGSWLEPAEAHPDRDVAADGSGTLAIDKHARGSSKGGKNRAEKSPKNAAKIMVRQRFEARKPKLWHHGDVAAFAKDMLVAFPMLTSTKVIEGWVRAWRASDAKSQSSS